MISNPSREETLRSYTRSICWRLGMSPVKPFSGGPAPARRRTAEGRPLRGYCPATQRSTRYRPRPSSPMILPHKLGAIVKVVRADGGRRRGRGSEHHREGQYFTGERSIRINNGPSLFAGRNELVSAIMRHHVPTTVPRPARRALIKERCDVTFCRFLVGWARPLLRLALARRRAAPSDTLIAPFCELPSPRCGGARAFLPACRSSA